MNKSLKTIICLVLLLLSAVGPIEAKSKKVVQKPTYMIGVAISQVDSVVFITDLHQVDSITIQKKTNFLMDRQLYSFQLQKFIEATYKGGPYVTAIFFGHKLRKMENKYLSLHKRYVQSKELRMILVDQSQFRFKPEKYVEPEVIEVEKPKKKDKNKK